LIKTLNIRRLKLVKPIIKDIINGPNLIKEINRNLGVDGDNIFIKSQAEQVEPDRKNSTLYSIKGGQVVYFNKNLIINLAANFLPRFMKLDLQFFLIPLTGDYSDNRRRLEELFSDIHTFDVEVISKKYSAMMDDNSKILSIKVNINGKILPEIPFLYIKNTRSSPSCVSDRADVKLTPTKSELDENADSEYHCCRPANMGDTLGCGGPTSSLAGTSAAAAASTFSSASLPQITAPLRLLSAGLGAAAARSSQSIYTKARKHFDTNADLCCLD